MIKPQSILQILRSSIVVALAYMMGIILVATVTGIINADTSTNTASVSRLVLVFIASVLLGAFLGPLASRVTLSLRQHILLWGSLILFNLGSVMLEGAYFAPDLVSIPMSVLVTQQLMASIGAALVITQLFASVGPSSFWKIALQKRSWYSWIWRLTVSSGSYLVFYFTIGGLNYQFITKPYYESHVGGLTVPTLEIVLIVESVRSMLIMFSIFLFLLSVRGTRHQLMIQTGWLLFAIGGVVPLVLQIGTLPFFLLASSAVEIFFQNFLTGGVAAYLLCFEDPYGNEAHMLVEQRV